MSKKILTYKEFSSIVPKETKKFVDDFLLSFSSNIDSDIDIKQLQSTCIYNLFMYMYSNYDSSLINIIRNSYDVKCLVNAVKSPEKNNTNIEQIFNLVSEIFCIKEDRDRCAYYYLIPEDFLVDNLITIFKRYPYIDDILRKLVPTQSIIDKLVNENNNLSMKAKLKFENEVFDNLSAETVIFLKTANNIRNNIDCKNNNYSANFFNLSALSLLLAFYKLPNLDEFKNYFSIINFDKIKNIRDVLEKLNSNIIINKLDSLYLSDWNYGIGNLFDKYKTYIEKLKQIDNDSPKDILNMIFDKNISNSIICEQIFKYSNPKLDLSNITQNIEKMKLNHNKIELQKIYNNLPSNICKYFKFVSKIVGVLKEKNKNNTFGVYYTDSDIVFISIFISLFFKDDKVKSYFIKNNITLNTVLGYLNLSEDDLDFDAYEEENNILEVYQVLSNANVLGDKIDIRFIILCCFGVDKINKILSDLNNKYLDCNVADDMREYFKNEINQKRINILTKFYGELDINVIRLLESSYIYYIDLSKSENNFDLKNDDLVQVSLLVTIYRLTDNKLSKYIYEKLFCQSILSKLNYRFSIQVQENDKIFNEQIDAKDFFNRFGKYIFGGKNKNKNKDEITINDILNNLFNKDISYSIKMKNFLNSFNLSYDDFADINKKFEEYLYIKNKQKEEDIKKEVLDKIKKSNCDFDIIDDIDKIYRIIQSDVDNKYCLNYTIFIYMYYRKNKYVKYLVENNITLDKILNYLNLNMKQIYEYQLLDTNYFHIKRILKNKILKGRFNSIIKSMFIDNTSHYSTWTRTIIDNLDGDFNIIKYEIENDKKYVPPLTKEEKLEEYLKMPIPKVEIENIEKISNFGLELSNQSEFISQTFHEFIENYSDESSQVIDLQEDFKDVYKEKIKGRKLKFFAKKNEETDEKENSLNNKKEVLDRLDEYLKNKEINLNNDIKELQYIRSLIAAYIQKAQKYLEECKKAKEILTSEIENKEYYENDFRVFDDNLRMQLIDDKISNMNMSILQMIQQYQRITMQMGTHITIINQISLARSSTIQNLYIELSLKESIENEKSSIASLNALIGILGNMSNMNSDEMVNNISKINMLSKSGEKVITDKDKKLIEQILDEQKLLELK